MELVIDRIEDSFAVLELDSGELFDIPLAVLPKGVKEGDVIKITITESGERSKRIKKLMDDLFE